MLYYSVVFFCTTALFLTLLEDRFRLWVTVAAAAAAFGLSLLLGMPIGGWAKGPILSRQLPVILCAALNFLASLFFYRDNPLQKFFVGALAVVNFAFADFFIPVFLGALPFSPAGGVGGGLSVLLYCLLTLLWGLVLYHPLRSFSERGVSGFLIGICVLLGLLYALSLGKLDFLFRGDIAAEKLLVIAILYVLLAFCFRSVYQAGRFKARTAGEQARARLLEAETANFTDLRSALREIHAARRESEYALETVSAMLAQGEEDRIPEYIANARAAVEKSPVLEQFHSDPYLNAILAMKAAFCQQNGIAFSCNVVTEPSPLEPMDVYVIVSEMLTRAAEDAAQTADDRRLRFTVFPSENTLRFEAVYSGSLPKKERLSTKGKTLSQVWETLFEEQEQPDDLHGLELTRELINRFSGSLSLSGTKREIILQAQLRF